MKQATKNWILAAKDDLLAAETLVKNIQLTHLAAFHCQQCLEKCFKASIEEQNLPSIKSHDLLRLLKASEISLDSDQIDLLTIINEVYIDARYPGDLGLLPHGKPTQNEIQEFIKLCHKVMSKAES